MVCRPPIAPLDEVLHDGRPDGSGDVAPTRDDRHLHAAMSGEPQRGVGDDRRERDGAGDADQQALGEGELPEACGLAGGEMADSPTDGPTDDRNEDAEAIGQASHQDAAEAEADHRHGVGQRGARARDAELRLDRRKRHDHGPHADTADRREQQRGPEPGPRVDRLGSATRDVGRRLRNLELGHDGRRSVSGVFSRCVPLQFRAPLRKALQVTGSRPNGAAGRRSPRRRDDGTIYRTGRLPNRRILSIADRQWPVISIRVKTRDPLPRKAPAKRGKSGETR